MNKWHKFIGLSASERSLLSQSLVLLPFTALALSVLGLKSYQRLLNKLRAAAIRLLTGTSESFAIKFVKRSAL